MSCVGCGAFLDGVYGEPVDDTSVRRPRRVCRAWPRPRESGGGEGSGSLLSDSCRILSGSSFTRACP